MLSSHAETPQTGERVSFLSGLPSFSIGISTAGLANYKPISVETAESELFLLSKGHASFL